MRLTQRVIMKTWIFDLIHRVPDISDDQIAEMRHIEPVLQTDGAMFQRIARASKLHPRDVSFLWNAEPEGELFTFHTLNMSTIITQHHSAVFFKPSLAEVYAWIRVYMPNTWHHVKFFCMGESKRIGASTDIMCECRVMGGGVLVRGNSIRFADGSLGYEMIESAP